MLADFDENNQFEEFDEYIRLVSRHVLNPINNAFLEAVMATVEKRVVVLPQGTTLYRSQIGSADEYTPFPVERMKPLRDRAREGRVNPKGIPCLYLSTERWTAMMEVRPWIGLYISLAEFHVVKTIRIVDCSAVFEDDEVFRLILEKAPSQFDLEELAWSAINAGLKKPAMREDDVAEYATTQTIAEAFRLAGYDGLMYGSSLGDGKTVALFDLSSADANFVVLHRVNAIGMDFTQIGKMTLSPSGRPIRKDSVRLADNESF